MLLQILILICLFAVIFLLSVDKVKITRLSKPPADEQVKMIEPDIMGKANRQTGQQRPPEEKLTYLNKFSGRQAPVEHTENSEVTHASPIMDIDQFEYDSDDEEDLDHEYPLYDDRFSSGVSLDELTKVGTLLQQDHLQTDQETEAIDILQKFEGTDIFEKLMESVENSSVKIARLLDKRLDEIKNESDLSGRDNFQIEDFL